MHRTGLSFLPYDRENHHNQSYKHKCAVNIARNIKEHREEKMNQDDYLFLRKTLKTQLVTMNSEKQLRSL